MISNKETSWIKWSLPAVLTACPAGQVPRLYTSGTTTAVPSHTCIPACCYISFLFLSELVTLSLTLIWTTGFPGGARRKESTCQSRPWFHSWVRKIPWRRKWQPTPAFAPGKSHGQRSLVGLQSWTRLSDWTHIHTLTHTHTHTADAFHCTAETNATL